MKNWALRVVWRPGLPDDGAACALQAASCLVLLEQWDTGWVDNLTGWAAAGHRRVAGANLPGRFNAQPVLRGAGWTGCSLTEFEDAAGDEKLVLLPDGQTYGYKLLPERRRLGLHQPMQPSRRRLAPRPSRREASLC